MIISRPSGTLFASLLVVGAFAAQPAHAEGSVSSLGMGKGARTDAEFQRYEAVVDQFNASGERFRIDTRCQSACTMFLAIRNVCISPRATLAFHAGGNMKAGRISPDKTQRMASRYNSALRQYVSDNHYMDTFAFSTISGSDMISRFGYPACR
jgi:hypothetical protein